MDEQLKYSREFQKKMATAGYVYNEKTKQFEQQPVEQASRITRRKHKNKKKQKHQLIKVRKPRVKIKKIVLMIICMFLFVTTVFDQAFWRFGSTYSVLFVGSDTSNERDEWKEENYADAIFYVVVEPWKRELTILPINRDMRVSIVCTGTNENINHAYNEGRMKCLRETVEQEFSLPVDYYVETNFNGFVEVVDALGGIELTAEKSFCEQNTADDSDAICFNAGEFYHMSGEQALAYARHRKSDNLDGRQRRQQQVIQAIVSQVFQPITLIRGPLVLASVVRNVATNVTPFGAVVTLIALLQSPEKTTLDYSGLYEITDNYHFYPDQRFWNHIEQLKIKFDK